MKIYFTKEQFAAAIVNLYGKIFPIRDKFEWVVGIERGGVHISKLLSEVLDKKHTSVKISFYGDGYKKSNPIIDIGDLPVSRFLLVDDIVDTSQTILALKKTLKHHPGFWIASLHWCPENSPNNKPDFYVAEKNASDWIVYPWEKKELFDLTKSEKSVMIEVKL